MSTLEVKPPNTHGQPGRSICKNANTANASAHCWASAPAKVTGLIAPAKVNGVTTVG